MGLMLAEDLQGGVAEWSKAPDSKSGVPFSRYRGFESHPLRCSQIGLDVRYQHAVFRLEKVLGVTMLFVVVLPERWPSG